MRTDLDVYEFHREQVLQQVQWMDIWHDGDGVDQGMSYTPLKRGVTTDGFGEGVRVLANTNLRPCDIASLLRRMADEFDGALLTKIGADTYLGPYDLHNAIVCGIPLAGFLVVGQMGGALVYDDGEVAVGGIYQGLDAGEGANCYVLIEKHQRPYFHIYPTLTQWYEGWHYWMRHGIEPGVTCDCREGERCPGDFHRPDDVPDMPVEVLQSLISIGPGELPDFTRSIPKTAGRVRDVPPLWLQDFKSKGRCIFGKPESVKQQSDPVLPF